MRGPKGPCCPTLTLFLPLFTQSPLVEPQVDDSLEPLPPTVEAAHSSTEEEVHYASLNFHEMKPRNPQEQQDTTTEYSEIKSHK